MLKAGEYGNMGRYSLTGHAVWNVDFSAIKNFRIRERQTVQVRFEWFNILNHPALGSPNLNWGGSSLTPSKPELRTDSRFLRRRWFQRGTAFAMRQLQFALKYVF